MTREVRSSNEAMTPREKALQEESRKNREAAKDAPPEKRTSSHPGLKLPSDIDALMTVHGLGEREADELYDRKAAGEDEAQVVDEIRARRNVNRKVYAKEPAGSAHPLNHEARS